MSRGLSTHSVSTAKRRPLSSLCREEGLATLIALIALAIFSLLSFYMAFGAKTEVRISDNYESGVQAMFAARAGMTHARELIRGPAYNDLLLGPNGVNDTSLEAGRTFSFRNPVPWATARALDILSPTADMTGINDDGVVSTGKYAGGNGTELVPRIGRAETAPNPYGAGTITTARYFVKVSDNNGEATELAGDGTNNPFTDGDNIIVVRSMGVAQTLREIADGTVRRNSVAVVEARFRMRTTFDLDAPFVIEGPDVAFSRNRYFDGNSFGISGGANNPGIATIDTNNDGSVAGTLSGELTKNQKNNITGQGGTPSIVDITGSIVPGSDKALLEDPAYLSNLVNNVIPRFADAVYQGNQHWDATTVPYLGHYDWTKPASDPSQDSRVTFVNGDLSLSGDISGGGLLVVTGSLNGNGHCIWNGLILVIGKGDLDMSGWNLGVHGGLFVAKLVNDNGTMNFGTPTVTIAGNSNIVIHSDSIKMGMRQIAPEQLGYREINSTMDP